MTGLSSNTGLLGSSVDSSEIVDGSIVNADINASAAIDATKIHNGTVSNTEFGYIGGLTSDAQTQLNGKAASGANSDITSLSGLTTPLSVAQGGSGAATLTGVLKGNGTSAFTAAVAGTDYYAPGGADVATADGGTGGDSSAATGVAQVASGTWSYSTALADGTTATTQTANDNSTKVATTAYVDAAAGGGGEWTYHSKVTFADDAGGTTKTFASLTARSFWKIVYQLEEGASGSSGWLLYLTLNNLATNYGYTYRDANALGNATGGSEFIIHDFNSSRKTASGEIVIDGTHRGGVKTISKTYAATDDTSDRWLDQGAVTGDSNNLSEIDLSIPAGSYRLTGTVELWYKDLN